MLRRREVILVKIESTYKTDPTPTTSDAVFISGLQFSNTPRMTERPGVKQTMGPYQSLYGGRTISLNFTCEIKGSGSLGVQPEFGDLLKICGLLETISTGASVTYTPSSLEANLHSATIYYYQDGKLKKLHGCVADVDFDFSAGIFGKANFKITGHAGAETDTALPSPTYSLLAPPPFVSAGLTVNGYSAVVCASLKLMLGNQIASPDDVNSPDGYGRLRVTDRDPNGTIDPEDVLIAAQDWYTTWTAGTLVAINTGVVGSVSGNRYQLTQPKCAYRGISENDRSGISTIEIPYGAMENAGDDQFSLVFT